MVMSEVLRRWTRQEVLDLPEDGNWYELFDGERLQPFVAGYNLGVILTSPADLSLGGDHLSQPDLFVLPGHGWTRRRHCW